MNKKMQLYNRLHKLNTAQIITLGFAGVIILGGLLLWLPFCTAPGYHTSFTDAMFTATTSICVTGLVTVVTATHWTLAGKIIILVLIQIGGVGLISLGSIIFISLRKKISLRNRRVIQESYNMDRMGGMVRLVKKVLICVFGAEGIGLFRTEYMFFSEKRMQEMRKLNYKNAELSEKIDVLVGENAGKLQGLQEDEQKLLSTLRDLTEEQTRNREEELSRKAEEKQDVQQDTKAQTKDIIAQTQELMTRSEDFVHKENVKVYRNVQAVIIEELKKQTDALCQENIRLASRMNVVMAFSLITMLVAVASLILQILTGLNIKLF